MQRVAAQHCIMGQDFFKYLPSEIILDILSRLPARTVLRCKCVCQPWLNLLSTSEFVKSHLSKSVPALAVYDCKTEPKPYKFIEFVDEVDLNYDEHHWDIVFDFKLPVRQSLHSSANGLLFLLGYRECDLVLCNPFTREYITIPSPLQPSYDGSDPSFQIETYGFGVSRMCGLYKLVRIFVEIEIGISLPSKFDQYECQVYTVGTASWRRIAIGSTLRHLFSTIGAFLNGNLHWLAYKGSTLQVSCIDLETELFSTFSFPPLDKSPTYRNLSVLRDCLCLCENSWDGGSSNYENIDIWLMKEYGDEKSWTKEFIIRKVDMAVSSFGVICPVKVFKDGSILMVLSGSQILFYSSRTNTIRQAILYGDCNIFSSMAIYTPSFLPLNTFVMEHVSSF